MPRPPHDEARRYARHHILPQFGEAGQARLSAAHVLVVGTGGLGAPLLTYLASSGIGKITLLDPDRVDASNLPRQILFEPGDVGRPKVDAARDRLEELNPDLQLVTHAMRFEDALVEIPDLLHSLDLMVDGSDNFPTRLAVNLACIQARVALLSGAMIGWQGQVGLFAGHDPKQPCYQCLVQDAPEQSDTCRTNGVIAPLGGIIGGMMALEAVKYLAGSGTPLMGRLAQYDALQAQWRESRVAKDAACPACNHP